MRVSLRSVANKSQQPKWGLLFFSIRDWGDSEGATMTTVDQFKVKARALARSGHFYGLPPLEFELRFEENS